MLWIYMSFIFITNINVIGMMAWFCCNIMKYIIWYCEDGYVRLTVMSDGMSKCLWYVEFYFTFLLHLYLTTTYQCNFNFNIILLVCWHDLVVLVWNIYLMLSWRWICFVCCHKWWYVEIGYFLLTVTSDGMSKCLWYVEFYFFLPLYLYLMSTYQWYF